MLGLVPISLPYSPLHASLFSSFYRIPGKGNPSYVGCPSESEHLIPRFLSVFSFSFLTSAESSPHTLHGGGLGQNCAESCRLAALGSFLLTSTISSRRFSLKICTCREG